MPYRLEYSESAQRSLQKFPRNIQSRILTRLEALQNNPRSMGAIKLTGYDAYRVRIGDYRVVYSILDDRLIILIIKIAHRRDIYREM